ncbi:exodeoxyribonuclease V subunit gamma [Chromobacterium vaccinii]|uniref:exodeoxyribonuclease V subunit gamma n=1 Tax=Chromobacterium vaccinii TaxID=1108595 RepID=UPI000E1AB589|nr:exodeoxyribonuclease V subunit gamma [Chromobacterium vaccinii]SUX29910.1 Exodeoxyribonuclease V gamma chain [Chromobacterium vaccinii]
MLFLYQSNRLEQLGELFCGMTQAMPLADPFAAETVIVQSRGMGRWITLDVARKAGIAANIDFALPAAFAWRLMQLVMPELPRKSAFVPEVLAWRLLALLPTLEGEPFGPVLHYLEGGEAAAFELAGKIADIFDQYLVFRPDWIRAWEADELLGLGEDEAWQAALWRQLAESDPGRHRVRMLDQFFSELKPEHLPPRVTLFGIASLAPMYLALVKRLAELTDVCLFTLNPCEAYWGDIVDARRMLKLRQAGDLFATQGHPLLSSLGKQGRDFFELIAEDAELDAKPLFAAPKGASLLARLQRDILELNDPSQLPRPSDPADDSVEVHACHGPMRELEALKDRLLAMFAADPKLSPADVAVLTPDINAYAPYIDAVFGRRDDAPNIPYSIADRRVEREQPLLSTFAAALKLADSRFAADEVLALLDCPALLARFDLADADLAFIQDWVRDAGIRWGGTPRTRLRWACRPKPPTPGAGGWTACCWAPCCRRRWPGTTPDCSPACCRTPPPRASWARRWRVSPISTTRWTRWPANGRRRLRRSSGRSASTWLATACSWPTATTRRRWSCCGKPSPSWPKTPIWPASAGRWAWRWHATGCCASCRCRRRRVSCPAA